MNLLSVINNSSLLKYHLNLLCKVLKNIYLSICISSINQPENQEKKKVQIQYLPLAQDK